MTTVESLIRGWKTRTGKSADDLARMVGCSRKAVYEWQSGRTVPSSRYRPALTDALGITPEELQEAIDAAHEADTVTMEVAGGSRPRVVTSALDEVAERLEIWRTRVTDARLPQGIYATIMSLPHYMRMNGEVRVTCEQMASDMGWDVKEVCDNFDAMIATDLVDEIRPGVYVLT